MPAPELWIIADPNGAGKTTTVNFPLFRKLLSHCDFINPDEVALRRLNERGCASWKDAQPEELRSAFVSAASDCEMKLNEKVELAQPVAVETVLSTTKYCGVVERVRQLGGRVNLIYITLATPALSAQRVAYRSSRGGHGVPAEKLEPRWKASLNMLPWFSTRSSRFWVLDNSESAPASASRLLASGAQGRFCLHGLPPASLRFVMAGFIQSFIRSDEDKVWTFELAEDYLVS